MLNDYTALKKTVIKACKVYADDDYSFIHHKVRQRKLEEEHAEHELIF